MCSARSSSRLTGSARQHVVAPVGILAVCCDLLVERACGPQAGAHPGQQRRESASASPGRAVSATIPTIEPPIAGSSDRSRITQRSIKATANAPQRSAPCVAALQRSIVPPFEHRLEGPDPVGLCAHVQREQVAVVLDAPFGKGAALPLESR